MVGDEGERERGREREGGKEGRKEGGREGGRERERERASSSGPFISLSGHQSHHGGSTFMALFNLITSQMFYL